MRPILRRLPWHLAFVASWLLVAAPTLCLAGMLEHPCDCERLSETCDCSEQEEGCNAGCSHDGCENDPCRVRLATAGPERAQLERDAAGSGSGPFFAPFPHPAAAFDGSRSPSRGHLAPTPPGARREIPFHLSDMPLLL